MFCIISPRAIKFYLKSYRAITLKKALSAGNSDIVMCGALNFSVIPTNINRNISTDSDANQIQRHVPVSDKVENAGRDNNRAFVKPDLPTAKMVFIVASLYR